MTTEAEWRYEEGRTLAGADLERNGEQSTAWGDEEGWQEQKAAATDLTSTFYRWPTP